MDPNQTLSIIRSLCKEWEESGGSFLSTESLEGFLDDLVEHVVALDDWLTNGGFHPSDWS